MTARKTCLYFLSALACCVQMGCNTTVSEAPSDARPNATIVASQEDGCCGKCAGDLLEANTPTEGCGKCNRTSGVDDEGNTPSDCAAGCDQCVSDANENESAAEFNGQPAKAGGHKLPRASTSKVNSMPEDRAIFHFLLQNHTKISRTVTELDNGVKTVTESADPDIATKIQEHVGSMYQRVEDGRPLRMWDDLYREIFRHADKIRMEVESTETGISVLETSDDEYVVKLIQEHAKVVSGFAERGFEEARQNHTPPQK